MRKFPSENILFLPVWEHRNQKVSLSLSSSSSLTSELPGIACPVITQSLGQRKLQGRAQRMDLLRMNLLQEQVTQHPEDTQLGGKENLGPCIE